MSTPPHLGGGVPQGDSNTIMTDVWGYLLVRHEVKSVLSIGEGYGHCVKWFAENGLCVVKAIDGDPDVASGYVGPKDTLLIHDFTKGPAPVGTPFDLAWSAEFLEHVEEQYIPNYMGAFQLCRRAVVTHGEPGQYGHHHVTLKSSGWWRSKFAEYGFELDDEETRLLRATDRWRAAWGRRTLMSFVRV